MSLDRTGTERNEVVMIGTDLVITHTVTDDNDAAVDLTNASYKALVKASADDADAAKVAEFTVDVVSAPAGTMKLTLPDTETAKLTDGTTYYYDLHVKLPASHATYPNFDDTPLWGRLVAKRIITRATS